MRADLFLVARGFYESRAKAQEAIAAGLVSVDGKILRKASQVIAETSAIEAERPYPWVSRGGCKLEAALDAFGFNPKGLSCLDIGASTGGFSHVLLEHGVAHIDAIDVGHGQMHPKLAADPRLAVHEGFDARNLTQAFFAQPPQVVTCDVSFISVKLILPAALPLTGEEAFLVLLIKPQFEAGPAHVDKGIVKSEKVREAVCHDIKALVERLSWRVTGLIPSPIKGGDGNQEYLLGAIRNKPQT